MPRTRTSAGFSLLEILLAMSLFAVLGVGLIALLSRASDFLTVGTSTTESLDALQTFSEAFEADVYSIYTQTDSDTARPRVRLLSDHVAADIDADDKEDARIQRLFFVRMIPHEATAVVTRRAGTKTTAKDFVDQTNDAEASSEGTLRATGGLMEAFWTAVPDSKDDLSLMTVYRGYRAPIGEEGSLLPVKSSTDPTSRGLKDRGPTSLKDVRAVARPVLSGVLHFGVEFWARRTKTWDPEVPPPDGALKTWDSTRGILPKGKGYDGFWFSKAGGFSDASALDDPTDDTFPRKMRVTVVVEQIGRNAQRGVLAEDISAEAKTLDLMDARFIPATDTARRHVKIGAEWIEFQAVEGTRLTGCRRGVRGTVAVAHGAGEIVHHGKTVVREYALATFRDAYKDELPTIVGRGGN